MPNHSPSIPKSKVVVQFAGDSGDGIQLSGFELTRASTIMGNDVRSSPDIPAEIRAPAGTLAGVSGFQLCFSNEAIYTPGDMLDALIAFNPAALKVCVPRLKSDGVLIIDSEKFTDKDFKRAHLESTDIAFEWLTHPGAVTLIKLPLTKLTLEAVQSCELSQSKARKCKNFLALGLVYWLYERDIEPTLDWIKIKFKNNIELQKANALAFMAGYHIAQNAEFPARFSVSPYQHEKGAYRHVTGNLALALGAVSASFLANRPLFMSGYPITPASDILHHLAALEQEGVVTLQAEDEMGAVGAALGASYAQHLGLTCTSGPGMDLKAEMMGLAVMAELPLVIVDVMRQGPSTGMPTRSEQSDLMMALYARHGECPMPVICALTPADCYYQIIEAFRLAVTYMTPVIVLSDLTLANGAEPMKMPSIEQLSKEYAIHIKMPDGQQAYQPYARDEETLARIWAAPGMKDAIHRLGGLEKDMPHGNISSLAQVHEEMVMQRAQKVQKAKIKEPYIQISPSKGAKILLVGWGSTYGLIKTFVQSLSSYGIDYPIDALALRALNPLPSELTTILKSYDKVFVLENNAGQLCQVLRAQTLVDCQLIANLSGRTMSVDALAKHFIERVIVND